MPFNMDFHMAIFIRGFISLSIEVCFAGRIATQSNIFGEALSIAQADVAETRLLMLCIRRMYSLSIMMWAPQRDVLRNAVCDIS